MDLLTSIFLTAVIFWVLNQWFISSNQGNKTSTIVKAIVLTIWTSSLITMVVSLLIKIWI